MESHVLTHFLLIAAEDATRLVLELQHIAHKAGHPVPLTIALDQENGGVNSLFDERHIRQFPSAMGLAATGSKKLAREVAKATGQELSAVGVNWILGPVLDVLANVKNQPLGVRTTGDDPQEVSAYGVEFLKGYHEAGLATCGKHFPSYGNLEFLGAQTDVPIITESLEQLSQSALVPYRNTISQGLDAVMVGGGAMTSNNMNVMHACLSEQIVHDLLLNDMAFNGVVVSECLEMDALSDNIGVGGGTVMAVKAGCDIIMLCKSFTAQQEAINGLRLGIENGMIDRSRIEQSLRRVLEMKSRCTSWERALNPAGIDLLKQLQPSHINLSATAYNASITVVRDVKHYLPIAQLLGPEEELLLLTPLVKPLPASAAYQMLSETPDGATPEQTSSWENNSSIMSGEQVFREFGRAMSRRRSGRVLHTSYTANGLRPMHEDLINRAGAIIVVTADAGRNLYQNGFTKHVSMICRMYTHSNGGQKEKPLIVVSVSSPYDFAFDQSIGTYVCTYDFTETALQALVRVLYGELRPAGALPGSMSGNQRLHQSRQHWLVENWNEERDSQPLDMLLKAAREHRSSSSRQSILVGVSSSTFLLRNPDIEEAHFVVRNSSTKELYGFCSTYYFSSAGVGVIGSIIVHPSRRKLSIGHSLHNRAVISLVKQKGITKLQFGSRLPSIFLGIPTTDAEECRRLKQWFTNMGWNISTSQMLYSMILRNLPMWTPPEGLGNPPANHEIKFDLVYGMEYAEPVLDHVKASYRPGVADIYKMALADKAFCGIIRAHIDGSILGSLVLYKSDSRLARFVPALADTKVLAGGITSPVILPSVSQPASLAQKLILLGIRQIKKQGASAVVLDCVRRRANILRIFLLTTAD